jgi:hypothetical protein
MTKYEKAALVMREVTVGATNVPAGQLVWVFERSGGDVDVEYRGEGGRVPLDALADLPIRGPGLEQLRQLDPCFGLPSEAFESLHFDQSWMFEIRRCRAHGRRFLSDTRYGFCERIILLEDADQGTPFDIWSKYHPHSDEWLLLNGRTL